MREIEVATEGRIVTDVETRTSKAGKPYGRFRLVVGDGDDAQWLSVTAVGPKAMEIIPSLAKSDRLYLEGSIKLEKWSGQDGGERSGLSVLAWKLVPLGKIGRSKPAQPRQSSGPALPAPSEKGRPATSQTAAARHWQAPPVGGGPADDVIPFAPEMR